VPRGSISTHGSRAVCWLIAAHDTRRRAAGEVLARGKSTQELASLSGTFCRPSTSRPQPPQASRRSPRAGPHPPMSETYRAERPWRAERPHTLVICCSDGRWHSQVVEFVQHKVSERPDMLAVPGGAAVVDPWSSSFDESRVFDGALRLLLTHHELEAIWLIAHEACAYYRERHPLLSPEELRRRQEQDLERARAILTERHPALVVRQVYAELEAERVLFTTREEP